MSFEADVVSFKLIMKPIFGSCSIDSKIVIIAASDGITNVPNATNTFPDEFWSKNYVYSLGRLRSTLDLYLLLPLLIVDIASTFYASCFFSRIPGGPSPIIQSSWSEFQALSPLILRLYLLCG